MSETCDYVSDSCMKNKASDDIKFRRNINSGFAPKEAWPSSQFSKSLTLYFF